MRRTLAALTTSAVLIPLAITAMPGAASAATNALTVHVYGRDGAKVSDVCARHQPEHPRGVHPHLQPGQETTQGHLRRRRRNRRKDDTTVLGGRTVKVSGSSSTVIDGRKGKPFQVSLNPPTGGDPRRSHGAHLRPEAITSSSLTPSWTSST